MKKLLAAIFGTGDNTSKIVNSAIVGIDKLVFTDEERSDASAKVAEWYLRYLAATQPQNLARRLIALVIVCLWALLVIAGVALYKLDAAYSAYIFDVLADIVMNPFLMVMGFYFAAHIVRTWQNGKAQN